MDDREFQQLSGCKNGNCPKIFRKGDRAAVQGLTRSTSRASHPFGGEVEIPLSVLLDAAPALGHYAREAGDGPTVVVLGDRVLVRGQVGTELTHLIRAPHGESVVEVSIADLAGAARALEAA